MCAPPAAELVRRYSHQHDETQQKAQEQGLDWSVVAGIRNPFIDDGQAVLAVVLDVAHELAVLVRVGNGDHDVVRCGVVDDILDAIVGLDDCVLVGAGLTVLDGTEYHHRVSLGGLLCELAPSGTLWHWRAVDCGESEGKALGLAPVADGLGCLDDSLALRGVAVRELGRGELGLAVVGDLKGAVAGVLDLDFDSLDVRIVFYAVDSVVVLGGRLGGDDLADLVGVGAHGVEVRVLDGLEGRGLVLPDGRAGLEDIVLCVEQLEGEGPVAQVGVGGLLCLEDGLDLGGVLVVELGCGELGLAVVGDLEGAVAGVLDLDGHGLDVRIVFDAVDRVP